MTSLSIFVPVISAEIEWITSIIFCEYLGIHYHLEVSKDRNFRIFYDDRYIELPNRFFFIAAQQWLDQASLPSAPLSSFNVRTLGPAVNLVSDAIPIIYGDGRRPAEITKNRIYLPIDIIGSAFFMLSRYEEAVSRERDEHDRFPAAAALACSSGFLERPIVDEYVEILWACMKMLFPRVPRKVKKYKTVVTCDVDHPYHPSARSLVRLVRRCVGETIRKRSYTAAIRPARNWIASRHGNWRNDPYYTMIDWMMEANERAANNVAFFFIPEITDPVIDDTCPIGDPAVRSMLKRIAERGHEIGIHPGYNSYQDPIRIFSAKNKLLEVLKKERIWQSILGGRQHYLRWSTRTPAAWNAADLEYDSTLGFPERAGFRCGTCHEYTMYDLHRRRKLKVRQRPLICMESAVIDRMGFGITDAALAEMQKLKDTVRRFEGNFTLLWHNSYFEDDGAREMYREIIA